MDDTQSLRSQTLTQALTGFMSQPQTSKKSEEDLRYASNRVKYKKDSLEKYDFCAEIHDTTRPPYHIDCLRKEFMREGGQTGGRLYPTDETMSFWNSLDSWMKVKGYIKRLSDSTDSANKQIQQAAILDFYGILMDPQPVKKRDEDPGLEIFWFTHSNTLSAPTTFLGRRVRTTIPFINRPLLQEDGSPIKKDMVSFVYFTNLRVAEDQPVQIRVTADDGFGTHFNSVMTNYSNTKRVNSSSELISLTYMAPTTFTMRETWTLEKDAKNHLTGYYHQGIGGFYYKLELTDGRGWMEIPSQMLQLTQDAFAPMISFQVEKSPSKYGCDFPFCDQRLGGHKMKWKMMPRGGPNWSYSVVPNQEYPFGYHAMLFSPGGGGIVSHFSMKLYSFMTMTMLVKVQEIPSKPDDILVLHSPLGAISVCLVPVSETMAIVSLVSTKGKTKKATKDNPTLTTGVPYLLVIRMIRDEYDVTSLNTLQIGAISLRGAQIDPKAMKESKPLVFEDPRDLEREDSTDGYTLYLGGQTKMSVYWMHFFDYFLEGDMLKKEALQVW
jgi:hypothetical protein